MKSKAHQKKCVELGIVPVPTHIDDSHIDHDQLAKQVCLFKVQLTSRISTNSEK